VLFDVLHDMTDRISEYLEIGSIDNNYFDEHEIDLLNMGKTNIFLNSILKLRSTVFTSENIDEIKKTWTAESGKYA
jgi:hypothetical protein